MQGLSKSIPSQTLMKLLNNPPENISYLLQQQLPKYPPHETIPFFPLLANSQPSVLQPLLQDPQFYQGLSIKQIDFILPYVKGFKEKEIKERIIFDLLQRDYERMQHVGELAGFGGSQFWQKIYIFEINRNKDEVFEDSEHYNENLGEILIRSGFFDGQPMPFKGKYVNEIERRRELKQMGYYKRILRFIKEFTG